MTEIEIDGVCFNLFWLFFIQSIIWQLPKIKNTLNIVDGLKHNDYVLYIYCLSHNNQVVLCLKKCDNNSNNKSKLKFK